MDRPLGALTSAVVGAAALLSLASPALGVDDPGPPLDGTPVTGAADPARAPELVTGRYLDRLPARGQLHYRLPRSESGSTFHVAAHYVGAGDSVGAGLRLQLGTTPGDQGCGSSGVFRPTLGEPAPVLFTTVSSWTDVLDHECTVTDLLHLSIGAPNDPADAGRPVEVLVYEEPPLSEYSFDLLPVPEAPVWTPLEPALPARKVAAGSTPTSAPVVGDGTYAIDLRPGRTVALAVPLDWDQALQAQLDAVLPPGAPATDQISVDVVGPLLGTSKVSFADDLPAGWTGSRPAGGAFRTGAQSHVVAHPNRDSYDVGINTESLAGIHYVLVRWTGTGEAGPAARDLQVPATLTLATTGTALDGIPAYTEAEGLAAPRADSRLVDGSLERAEVAEAPSSQPDTTKGEGAGRAAVVGAAVLALLAGLVVALRRRTARRRAERHRHAGPAHPGRHHEGGGRHRD